jgi:hypothetical protein
MARQSSFRFAAIILLATVLGTSCYADDLIVEKKTFSLPSYTTVAGETNQIRQGELGIGGHAQ